MQTVTVFTADQHHFADQNTGVGDQRATWFQNDFRQFVTEILMQETGNFFCIGFQIVGTADVVGREATTQVNHFQFDAVFFFQTLENYLHFGNRRVPGTDITLLRTYVERNTVRHQTQITRQQAQVHRHIGLTTEFTRQWPVGSLRTFSQNTHKYTRTRRRFGDIAQVGF